MPIFQRARRRGRSSLVLGIIIAAAILVGVAGAATWTDKEDYSPGSTVTISGDNGDAAGYLAGETVRVEVSGPNDWTATCEGTADGAGAWSCQVTLAGGPEAVGEYSYTATGLASGTAENGSFTDGSFFLRAVIHPAGTAIAVTFPTGATSATPGTLQSFRFNNTCTLPLQGWQAADVTTLATGAFNNLTSLGTFAPGSNRLEAPASVVIGGITYSFDDWEVVASGANPINGSVAQTGTVGCFSGWNSTIPTFVEARYVLAQGTLSVTKVLANATGKVGNKTAADFQFDVAGTTASSNVAFEADGQNDLTVTAGNYTVTEDAENGYASSYTNSANSNTDCTSIAVASGNTTTCTITNTFNGYTAATTTEIQDADASIVIGNSITDKAMVTGDADGGDPLGNVDFYLCGPTDPSAAYVACDKNASNATKVKDNATLVSDGNAGTHTSTASYTVTAAQLAKAGKYCMLAEYEGSTLYNGDADDGLTNECFIVTPAAATVTYTGAFDGVAGAPTALTATVESSYKGCASSPRVVTFMITDGGTTTATATLGTASGTGPYTGTASGSKVLAADIYDVVASVAGTDLAGNDGFIECQPDADDAKILAVAEAGSDAQGGGWYKAPDATPPRVNFGFSVKKQRDLTYKGQILWMNNEKWRLKGTLNGYGVIDCPTTGGPYVKCGIVTGTGTLYEWFSKTEEWGNPQAVTFTAKFYDGGQTSCAKKNCAKQERPDWFGMVINVVNIAPESTPQQLMGGSVKAGT